MDFKLQGKVALVTGAGSQIGFGKEIALTLAREGCEAIGITDINLDDAKLTAEAVKAAGAKSIAVKADVTNKEEVEAMVKEIHGAFGKLDIVCNVAGAILGRRSAGRTEQGTLGKGSGSQSLWTHVGMPGGRTLYEKAGGGIHRQYQFQQFQNVQPWRDGVCLGQRCTGHFLQTTGHRRGRQQHPCELRRPRTIPY